MTLHRQANYVNFFDMRKFTSIFISLAVAVSGLLGLSASASAAATISYEKVYFASESAALTTSAKKELRHIAKEYSTATAVTVTGYVQSAGSPSNNAKLSKARAKAVAKYLKAQGMKAAITTKSGGVPGTNGKSAKARRATLALTTPTLAVSPPVSARVASGPSVETYLANTSPSVCATPTVGTPCLATIGTGTVAATYSYQWQISSNGTESWSNVAASGTGTSYEPVSGDETKFLRIQVTGALAGYTTKIEDSPASGAVAGALAPLSNTLVTTREFTIQMWIKPTANFNNGLRHEFFAISPANDSGRIDLWHESQGDQWTLYVEGFEGSFHNFSVGNGSAPVIGRWYNIVLTRDSAFRFHVFVDGVEKLTTGPDVRNFSSYTKMRLGADPGGGNGSGDALMTNLRIVDGYNLFQANFTPNTGAPTAVAGTTFLLKDMIPKVSPPNYGVIEGSGGAPGNTDKYFVYIAGVDSQLKEFSRGTEQPQVISTSPDLPITCAMGGVCAIGDVGPS